VSVRYRRWILTCWAVLATEIERHTGRRWILASTTILSLNVV